MKSILLAGFFLMFTIFSTSAVYSKDLSNYSLISHYPLSADANDKLEKNTPMTLTNTPFQDGGIFCNGNYEGTDADPCNALTPAIAGFDFSSFAISVSFKINQAYDSRKPIIVGGNSWRWMTIFIDEDNKIGLALNDTFTHATASQTQCSVDSWHTVSVTYDGSTSELYFDDTLIDTQTAQLNHNNDNVFTISHGGLGRVFDGVMKDLKIYEKSSGGGGGGGCFISAASE